jgi:hypothetical protein
MSLISTMLESSGVVKRPIIGRDTAEGVTQPAFNPVTDLLPCSIQQASVRVITLYAQRNSNVTTTIYFAQNPMAQVNDIFVGTDRTGKTLTYLVKGEAQSVGRGRLWQIEAEWIPEPGPGMGGIP